MNVARGLSFYARWVVWVVLLHGERVTDSNTASAADRVPKIAVITTVWYHNSHADLIAGRLLEGHTLDGRGEFPQLKLASLYTDQVPENDKSRALAAKFGFPIYDSVAKALTLGGDRLAVDGVLLIVEHGKYPESDTGQFQFPKRRLFSQILPVLIESRRVVPIFFDKHLADTWADIAWIDGEAQRLKIPLLAGSSLPLTWRYPPLDVAPDKPLQEIVATSYHRLDSYGFHALEIVQSLAEQRRGGETGVKQVRCLQGAAVWDAGRNGLFDRALLDAAVARAPFKPPAAGKRLEEIVQHPSLFTIDYRDGLRASVVTLDSGWNDWSAAWKYADGQVHATRFFTQELRPFMHFTQQLKGFERLVQTGQSLWPTERTVLTSGLLDALLISRRDGGRGVETPHLGIRYPSSQRWQQPPPPPPDRPLNGP